MEAMDASSRRSSPRYERLEKRNEIRGCVGSKRKRKRQALSDER